MDLRRLEIFAEVAELMSAELVVVVPAEHDWARRQTVTLADVQAEPYGGA